MDSFVYLVSFIITFAGFTHSAFALGYEAGINKCTIDGNLIPPGALITFVQKGLQYLEMEANLNNVSILSSFLLILAIYVEICLENSECMLISVCFKLARVMQRWMKISRFYNL